MFESKEERDSPENEGDPILMRGHNISAVPWVDRRRDLRDARVRLLMQLLKRLELASGWCTVAEHVLRVENVLAGRISRWYTVGASWRKRLVV